MEGVHPLSKGERRARQRWALPPVNLPPDWLPPSHHVVMQPQPMPRVKKAVPRK